MQKTCISSYTLEQLAEQLKAMGQPAFRAKQIFHWLHQKLVTEFSAMTDQPKALLAKLEDLSSLPLFLNNVQGNG